MFFLELVNCYNPLIQRDRVAQTDGKTNGGTTDREEVVERAWNWDETSHAEVDGESPVGTGSGTDGSAGGNDASVMDKLKAAYDKLELRKPIPRDRQLRRS
jgi:hypothetical protein